MSLDLNMVYYHKYLRKEAVNLCTTILPWGNYLYKCLPTGVSNSPEIFQDNLNEMFRVLEFIRVYINDILTISKGDWSGHLEKLEITKKS